MLSRWPNSLIVTSSFIIGEIAISPTLFVTVIFSSVIWPNTIFLFGHVGNITKIFCCIFKITTIFWSLFYITISFTIFHHQVLVPFLYHQNCSPFWTECVAKRPLNHQFSAYITKILWTNDESLKCSENNKQTKTKDERGEKAQQQELVVHLLESIDGRNFG